MEMCGLDTLEIRLPYAQSGARYRLTDEDSGETVEYAGDVLSAGVTFALPEKRCARLVWVEKI